MQKKHKLEPVKRVYISKGEDSFRPLGTPTTIGSHFE